MHSGRVPAGCKLRKQQRRTLVQGYAGRTQFDGGQALSARRDPRFEHLPGLELPKMRAPHRLHMHEYVLAAHILRALHEAIAANAIEPFDLHRLELAGRFRKRLAVGPFGGGNGRARLLRQGRTQVDGQDSLGLQAPLKTHRHTFDDRALGHASAAMLTKYAEVEEDVTFHLLADEEPESARRIEPFHAAS